MLSEKARACVNYENMNYYKEVQLVSIYLPPNLQ